MLWFALLNLSGISLVSLRSLTPLFISSSTAYIIGSADPTLHLITYSPYPRISCPHSSSHYILGSAALTLFTSSHTTYILGSAALTLHLITYSLHIRIVHPLMPFLVIYILRSSTLLRPNLVIHSLHPKVSCPLTPQPHHTQCTP